MSDVMEKEWTVVKLDDNSLVMSRNNCKAEFTENYKLPKTERKILGVRREPDGSFYIEDKYVEVPPDDNFRFGQVKSPRDLLRKVDENNERVKLEITFDDGFINLKPKGHCDVERAAWYIIGGDDRRFDAKVTFGEVQKSDEWQWLRHVLSNTLEIEVIFNFAFERGFWEDDSLNPKLCELLGEAYDKENIAFDTERFFKCAVNDPEVVKLFPEDKSFLFRGWKCHAIVNGALIGSPGLVSIVFRKGNKWMFFKTKNPSDKMSDFEDQAGFIEYLGNNETKNIEIRNFEENSYFLMNFVAITTEGFIDWLERGIEVKPFRFMGFISADYCSPDGKKGHLSVSSNRDTYTYTYVTEREPTKKEREEWEEHKSKKWKDKLFEVKHSVLPEPFESMRNGDPVHDMVYYDMVHRNKEKDDDDPPWVEKIDLTLPIEPIGGFVFKKAFDHDRFEFDFEKAIRAEKEWEKERDACIERKLQELEEEYEKAQLTEVEYTFFDKMRIAAFFGGLTYVLVTYVF